jgi:hypothetical protein
LNGYGDHDESSARNALTSAHVPIETPSLEISSIKTSVKEAAPGRQDFGVGDFRAAVVVHWGRAGGQGAGAQTADRGRPRAAASSERNQPGGGAGACLSWRPVMSGGPKSGPGWSACRLLPGTLRRCATDELRAARSRGRERQWLGSTKATTAETETSPLCWLDSAHTAAAIKCAHGLSDCECGPRRDCKDQLLTVDFHYHSVCTP